MKSTFGRTFTTAAAILFSALVLLGVCSRLLMKEYLTGRTISELEQDADVIATLANAYVLEDGLSSRDFLVNLDVACQVSDADAVICNSQGQVILCSESLLDCEHIGMQISSRDYLAQIVENGGDTATGTIQGLYEDTRYIVSLPISNAESGDLAGFVIVSTPIAATDEVVHQITSTFLSVAMIVVLIAVLAVSLFARQQSRPMKDMVKVTNAFSHGELDARVVVKDGYSVEAEELALAFNNMATVLQKGEYQRQEFVANVSHELKTPMTTISGYVDGILDGTIPPERQRHYLQIVSDETKRLSRLVRSMLDISQLQGQEITEDKKMHFDLAECAGEVLITFEKKINDKRLDVDVDFPDHPVYTIAGRDYITQVIYNLIDNAVKFSPEGGTLGLKIKEGGGKAYVSISNQGDTIPPEELPLVFDRFHKLDKSRSQNRDGWGLGLYIVKTIVCSHGENISVTSKNGLTEFTFTMPLD